MRTRMFVAACLALVPLAHTSAQNNPNIVLFLVDDMGWQDTSVEFHSERTVWNDLYNTPNMQRLADQGMRFTDAYAASPVCSPTRATLITGQNPGRSNISDWVGHGQSQNSQLRSPAWTTQGLQPGDGNTTLPQVLSDAGYLTAHVGKAHFGNGAGANPANLGFDINIGGSHVGSPRGQSSQGAYFAPFPINVHPGLEDHANGTYITEALTAEANNIIDQAVAQEQPFFINLAHYAIHTPISGQGDPAYIGNYNDGRPSVERHYAAMIESMDASLGAIMDNLEAEGVADNTIILFMSDNGGLSNHTRANTSNQSDAWARDFHNTPLSSGKGAAYEGGIRVPMIVAWAGQEAGAQPINSGLAIQAGSINHEPVHADDFFPTILSLAGVNNPVDAADLDGQDLTGLLTGDGFEREGGLFWHYPHQWYQDIGVGLGIQPFSAVRVGDHKLIYFYSPGGGTVELYNLADDLGEQTDLSEIADSQDELLFLSTVLRRWMEDADAQLPIDRATGQAVDISNLLLADAGDNNFDGFVGIEDLDLLLANWGDVVARGDLRAGDWDEDGIIGQGDLDLLLTNWGEGTPPETNIPEPASALSLGGLMAMCMRRGTR